MEVQLKELEVEKSRLTLHAPKDGKILSILQNQGEKAINIAEAWGARITLLMCVKIKEDIV